MHIDWWTLGLQAVNVLVLVWLLGRFLFRPVAAMVAERRAAAARLLEEARAARDAAEAERTAARKETAEIAAARAEVLKQSETDAARQTEALLAAARAEAARMVDAAKADIARLRQEAALAADDRAGRLAADIAEKLFARLPDEARIAGFMEGLADGIAGLPETIRGQMAADGVPLPLTAARALSPAEAEACRARLSAALGRPVAIDVRVDPALIAGLEVAMPHATVRNSFRADLARIRAALSEPRGTAP